MKNQEATTIWQQISTGTKMACGAREPSAGTDNNRPYLCFKVTITKGVSHRIQVWLEPNDTYTVALLAQRKFVVKEVERAEDIYCDNLSEIIYRMCNKCGN